MKSILGTLGALLLTLGTIAVYIAYAVSERQFVLVSTMFQHWPMAGSLTFGIGNTMMGLALYSPKNMYPVIICMSSAWAVVGSSEYYGYEWIRVAHFLATALLLLTSYMVFMGAYAADEQSDEIRGLLSAVLTFFSALAVLSGVLLGISPTNSSYQLWLQTMAASELALLGTYFFGYMHVFLVIQK